LTRKVGILASPEEGNGIAPPPPRAAVLDAWHSPDALSTAAFGDGAAGRAPTRFLFSFFVNYTRVVLFSKKARRKGWRKPPH
jgi:hypothetical protein